jgi:hypothetical protein
MKKIVFVVGVVMIMLLTANQVQAEVCQIVNGSFEDDGRIPDITVKEPNGWDASVPSGKFQGYVYRDWVTDGRYNLTLYSESFTTFEVNDIATVSQQAYLADTNQIMFDLKLDVSGLAKWDPSKCTAVLLIDDDVVWESNSVGPDVRGPYRDRAYTVEDKYKDGLRHKLSLGIRVNVKETLWGRYVTQWDFIRCTVYCGGGGFLVGDFNRDCYVDANDLKLLTELWLDEVEPNDKCNLFGGDDLPGGVINFPDFAFFADRWDGDISHLKTFADKWLKPVDINDQDNLSHTDDVKPSGVINFFDFAIFADTWLGSSYIEEAP